VNRDLLLRTFYLDPDEAQTPRNGVVLTNRWWLLVDGMIAVYGGFAPQCNHSREFVEHLAADGVFTDTHDCAVRHIPAVYLGPADDDGRYRPPDR
jgi:hypothetical protein